MPSLHKLCTLLSTQTLYVIPFNQFKLVVEKYSTDVISDNFTFIGSKSDSMGDTQFDNQSKNNDDFNQTTTANQDDDVPF